MGRLINTGDLHNRLQAYDGFGALRGNILGIIENVVMDCPTATDSSTTMYNTGREDALLEVLKIIDIVKDYVDGTKEGKWADGCKAFYGAIRPRIEALQQGNKYE